MVNLDFSNLKIGKKQQVGVMSVFPLIGEDVKTKLSSFEDIDFIGTDDYGEMVFKNNGEYPFMLPSGYSIMTKQQAQDHALPLSTLLPAKEVRCIKEACCIEATMPGYIDGKKVKGFNMLPIYIRKRHLEDFFKNYRKGSCFNLKNYSRLWEYIFDFQSKLIDSGREDLVLFFNKFMNELIKFNAEFEVVKGQRGAIILINDKVIGIEVVPTQKYWKTIWNSLIRDCYGSEVIRLVKQNLIENFKDYKECDIKLDDCKSISEIRERLEDYYNNERKKIEKKLHLICKAMVNEVQGEDIIALNSDKNLSYHIFKLFNKDVYGEVYQDNNNNVIYCSMLF